MWREQVARVYNVHADRFIGRFLDATDFKPAIRKFTPGLMEEVEGLAKGADVDLEAMLAFQLMDEVWMNGNRALAEKCTAVGVDGAEGRPTIVAQNMDIEGFRNGYQVVVRHRIADAPDQMVLTCAGLIATTGLNSAGLGVCVNALTQLRYKMKGLPVAFVVRGLLGQSSLDEAAAFVTDVEHATGQNYLMGDSSGVRSFECSEKGAAEYDEKRSGALVHTNHPLASSDYTPQHSEYVDAHPNAPPGGDNSRTRFQTAHDLLAQRPGAVDPDWVKAILSSGHPEHPICAPYLDVASHHTFGSVVMELAGDPVMHASAGPPDLNGYHEYRF
jgi:hypothetical protein